MTLSVRLEPDVEKAFELEVKRQKTTKSLFFNELLREALKPQDPMDLLMQIRERYGIATPTPHTQRTDKAANVNKLVRAAAKKKHRESSAG